MSQLIHEKETYAILGARFEVYQDKGCGFLEAVYQECLEIEFDLLDLPARALVPLALSYQGRKLKKASEADFICYDKVPVELKGGIGPDGRAPGADPELPERNRPQGRSARQLRALSQSGA